MTADWLADLRQRIERRKTFYEHMQLGPWRAGNAVAGYCDADLDILNMHRPYSYPDPDHSAAINTTCMECEDRVPCPRVLAVARRYWLDPPKGDR